MAGGLGAVIIRLAEFRRATSLGGTTELLFYAQLPHLHGDRARYVDKNCVRETAAGCLRRDRARQLVPEHVHQPIGQPANTDSVSQSGACNLSQEHRLSLSVRSMQPGTQTQPLSQ